VLQQGIAGDSHSELLQEPRSGLPSKSKRHVGEPAIQPVGASRVVTYEPGSRSAKIVLLQELSSQKNRRTCRRKVTGIPCQGRSESVRR
jgi:hypothetical protein